jgi:anti-sigma regulatory factor (Ser/Thr protein kinase)
LDGPETVVSFHRAWAYAQPWALAAIAAWGLAAQTRGVDVVLENGEVAEDAWRFGLHRYLGIAAPMALADDEPAGRFLPLSTVATSADLKQLLPEIAPLLHISDEAEKAVLYIVSELVRNVLEHARSENGAVLCARYYPGEHFRYSSVSVGVADTGQGVFSSLSANYAVDSDGEALRKAIQPGVSGASRGVYGSSDNAGAGLFFARRLAQVTDGYFGLASGGAWLRTRRSRKRREGPDPVYAINGFPGTIVGIDVTLLDDDVEFSSFMRETLQLFTEQNERVKTKVGRGLRFE